MELCWPFTLADCPVADVSSPDPSDGPSDRPGSPTKEALALQAAELQGPRECDPDPYPLLSDFFAARLEPEKRAHLPTINTSMNKSQRENLVRSHLSA